MNKVLRNFWLDVFLLVLLGVNLATFGGVRSGSSAADLNLAGHLHIFTGILLLIGCLVHIGLHWRWFQAVLTGKAKGRIKLFMNCLVMVFLLLAGMSGPTADASTTASRLHSLTGSLALLGLFIHSVKHTRWMASVVKILIAGRQENALTPAPLPAGEGLGKEGYL
jgi:hypothetical protein